MIAVLATLRADLRARWRAMTVLAVIVAVATAAIVSAASLAERTATAFERELAVAHAGDAWLGAERVPMASFAITPAPSLEGVAGVRSEERFGGTLLFFPGVPGLDANDQLAGVGLPVVQLIALDDPRDRGLEVPIVSSGRLPNWDSPDEILVSEGVAAAAGWTPGSRVAMQYFDRVPASDSVDQAPTIADLERLARHLDVTVVGIGNYATVSTGTELILTTPEFSRVYDPIAQYTAHLVQLGPSTTAQQVIDAAAAAGRGEFSVTTDTPSRVEAYRASVRPDVVGLQVFSGVAALVAILVLGSLLGREAAVTGADHAVRRALGMTRGQLLAIHLSRIGITASGGVAVGSALAVALSGLLVRGSTRSVDPDKGVRIEVLVLLLGALIMLVSPILCAIPAVRRVVDTRPASTPKTSHVAQRFAASGAPVTFALGVGHAFGSGSGRTTLPSRTASVVAGLAVGVAAAAGLFAVNVDRLVADPAQYGVTWNVVLGSTFDPNRDCPTSDPQCEGGPVLEQRSSELAAFVQGRVGIRASTPYTTATIAVDGQADLTIVGFGDGGVRPVILSGVEPRDGDLAMGAVELRDRHLHVGDTIVTGDGTALRIVGTAITAAGTHDSSPELGHGAITTYATAQSLVTAPTDTGFLVAVDEDTAAALTRAFHAEFTTDAFSISPARDPREIIDYRRIRATPAALAIVVAAMAIATLALGVASSLQRRRRDVAVLRALGITTRQAIAIAVFHAAASAGLVLVGGTAIGLAAGRSVWTAVARHLGTEGATTWPSMTLAVAMSCTVLTVSAALILPCRQAARSPAGELLRVE